MGASLSILALIAVFSLISVRMGALALMKTGLSADSANFQSYSAFFGVGFTTKEAELVVNHPIRRRIIRDLILVGNLGLMSGAATVVATAVHAEETIEVMTLLGMVVMIPITFKLLSKVKFLQRLLDKVLRFTLRRVGMVRAFDYELLLRVRDGYCVSEIELLEDNPVTGKSIGETRPADSGVIILGIEKENGTYLGAPGPQDRMETGDVMMVYGKEESVHEIAFGHLSESEFDAALTAAGAVSGSR
tara:strand:+ start:2258 stop:2998 length:741 start_codon:yes stop_codon:yes gene_type:complete